MPEVSLWHWGAFTLLVVTLLAIDLSVFHRQSRVTSVREAFVWTVIWCSLAMAFSAVVGRVWGGPAAIDFVAGYLVEWSLSMDNVFVFAVIFRYFRVPAEHQYRVLYWGILGAIVMRLTFVLAGAELLRRFDWMSVVFGAVLVMTGIRMVFQDEDPEPEKNIVLRLARRILPLSHGHGTDRFMVIENGKRYLTPLFLVLLVVESTDVVFAVDSVPAIFGVVDTTTQYMPFIVFTSNVFAILGLRALYFLLAGMLDAFHYLSYGLAAVLVFVGVKMGAEYLLGGHDGEHLIRPWVSLVVIVALLATSVVASLIWRQTHIDHAADDEPLASEEV